MEKGNIGKAIVFKNNSLRDVAKEPMNAGTHADTAS
jgi:hypothetical protein